MKHTLQQVFHSGRFAVGFAVFMAVLLIVIIYPLIVPYPPLEIIGQGTFFPPGIYVNVYDSIGYTTHYTLMLDNAAAKRLASKLNEKDRLAMKEWLAASGIPEDEIDTTDTEKLLDQWANNFDPKKPIPGMTNAKRNYYIRLDASLDGILSTEGAIIAAKNPDTGALEEKGAIEQTDYANVGEVPNVRVLPLGTDNFGRDVLTELVRATGVSLLIGFVAGTIATLIGLTLGLLAGYVGGLMDDGIMFVTNLFTVIPTIHCVADPDLLQHRAGTTRRGHDRGGDRGHLLGMDYQGRAGASDLSAQSRPCQPVETVWALDLLHHPGRYSAVYRLLCRYGADPADFHGYPGGGRIVDPWVGTQNYGNANLGADDVLGHDLPGANPGKVVGVLSRGHGHSSDIVLAELDEYRSRPGIQSHIEGLGG